MIKQISINVPDVESPRVQCYNGGKLLVDYLIILGATKCFGVPGESYLAVLDALHDAQGVLDFILCRNEGGAAFMSAAYGKLSGTPGICFVSRGPGATNASCGVHTAMQDSIPMLLFVGQVATGTKGREAFQEIDYCGYFGTIAKWVTEIESVDRIPEIVARAWTTAISGRPGPVVVALPEDVLTDATSVTVLRKPVKIEEAAPTAGTVEAVLSLLAAATRPLVLVGGGGWRSDGKRALQHFAEKNNLPVLAAFRYQDLFDNHSPNYAGDAGVGMTVSTKELIKSADLILALNVRLGEITTDGYSLLYVPAPRQKLIHVHASQQELGKIYIPNLAIHAGPNAFVLALERQRVDCSWGLWCIEARNAYEASFELPAQPGNVDMGKVMAHLRDRLPEDAILTNGAGNFTIWPNKFFKFGPDQRLLAPQSGAMGFGIPAAIAAKIAEPQRVVVCFSGDGDFQMNCQELGTAMQADAQPIVLILNNGIHGTIRMHQERNYPGRVFGTSLQNPNFCMLAKSYGFHVERVTQTDEFADKFERALASETGAVLELIIETDALTPQQTLRQIRESALAAQEIE